MKWVSTFSYLPVNHGMQLARITNHIQKVVFDNNLDGDKVRIRFSNLYSKRPLSLQRVTIGNTREGKSAAAAEATRFGRREISLRPGEECWSDEILLPVSAGDKIEVYIYIKNPQSIGSVCTLVSKTGAMVYNEWPDEEHQVFYGFCGVQVLTEDSVKTIAAFGDSITQMSALTNALGRRLSAVYPGAVALINCGLDGSRLLYDARRSAAAPGCEFRYGKAGIRRFEKDVFDREESVDSVLVLIGINDILHPMLLNLPGEVPAPEQLIEGYRMLTDTAHRHGAKILLGTLPPGGSTEYPQSWMDRIEKSRQAVNDWIRTGQDTDGWVDFDRAVRDEANPAYMRPEYHVGDGLHPNEEGGAAMASAVILEDLV